MTAARRGAWVTAGGLIWLDSPPGFDAEVCPLAPAAVIAADTTLAPTTSGVADLTGTELTMAFGAGVMEAVKVTDVAGLFSMLEGGPSASAQWFLCASDGSGV